MDVLWYILGGAILLYTGWCLARWWKGRKTCCGGNCAGCPQKGKCGRK